MWILATKGFTGIQTGVYVAPDRGYVPKRRWYDYKPESKHLPNSAIILSGGVS